MAGFDAKRFIPQPVQLFGVTLIGIILLSALLYYKAVKAQRYLEPSLAIASPRIEFAQRVNELLMREFGPEPVPGIFFAANSIYIEDRLLFGGDTAREKTDSAFIGKFSRVLLSMLDDPDMRRKMDLILISTSLPVSPHPGMDRIKRIEMQHVAEMILDALHISEPRFKAQYEIYFAATAMPVSRTKSDKWVEFRIIPSEHLHTEMIRSLEKYYF